ncbi:MAG: hypothetical protein QXD23_01255 [Candidatus Micrarchaeaceae archaeon]
MEGLITTIKILGNSKKYNLLSIKNNSIILNETILKEDIVLGSFVKIDNLTNKLVDIQEPSEKNILEIKENLLKLIDKELNRNEYVSEIKEVNLVINKITPILKKYAKIFLLKLFFESPIIIRFHNDADGSSGAYSIYLSILEIFFKFNIEIKSNINWLMQKNVVYELGDAIYDKNLENYFSNLEKPLLFITDFGTSTQSNKGIEKISETFDIIWLDHHPIEKGFIGQKFIGYLNPWNVDSDSEITAGFLSSLFGYVLSGKISSEIVNASFIGDYSKYANLKKPGNDLALFLDMATSDPSILGSYNPKNITPIELHQIISDKEKYLSFVNTAKMKLEEAIEKAKNTIKKYKANETTIYVCDFSSIKNKESKYPLPGRFSSKLLDELLLNSKNSILLLHFGVYISIRIPKDLSEKVKILKIIEDLKSNNDEVDSGGGHSSAASIKLYDSADKKFYIKLIIEKIKENLT